MSHNSIEVSLAHRRFEQFLVLFFLALPPIGGLVVLAQAIQDPIRFWTSVGWIAYLALVATLHIRFVRPIFRRWPLVRDYADLRAHSARLREKHPKLVARAWRNRILRSSYRFLVFLLTIPGFVGLYHAYGHHFLWFFFGYLVLGFGVTVGYHRTGTHPTYKGPAWVRGLFLAMGSMAMQGPAREWIKKHHKHHTFSETTLDPHSPWVFEESKRGIFKEHLWSFMHSFVMWAFREPSLTRPPGMSIDAWKQQLLANPPSAKGFRYRGEDGFYWSPIGKDGSQASSPEVLIQKRWVKLVDTFEKVERDKVVSVMSNPLVYVGILAASLWIPLWLGGISIWESLARVCFGSYVTFAVNSVCHLWGEQPFRTPDNSKNNAYIEILALGEGGHNTHHRAELWAQHGIFAWQFDPAAHVIKGLRALGLATDLKLATKEQVRRAWLDWRKREPWMQGLPAKPAPTPAFAAVEQESEALALR